MQVYIDYMLFYTDLLYKQTCITDVWHPLGKTLIN